MLARQSEGIKEASSQTAVGSEQAKSAAEELKHLAINLKKTLIEFTI